MKPRLLDLVCPRCLYIRPDYLVDCACTYRMAALEKALRELAPDHEALGVNEQLAATNVDGQRRNLEAA